MLQGLKRQQYQPGLLVTEPDQKKKKKKKENKQKQNKVLRN